jgi:hypothetical protein
MNDETAPAEIKDLTRLKLAPDDVLVVRMPFSQLSAERNHKLQEEIIEYVGQFIDNRIMLLDSNMEIFAITEKDAFVQGL